jgi:hypothetical protein
MESGVEEPAEPGAASGHPGGDMPSAPSVPSPLRSLLPVLLLALLAGGCEFEFSVGGDAARGTSVDVGADQVVVGDCFDDPMGDTDDWVEVDDVRLVPCDDPHDLEAFHSFELPDGDLPSEAALDERIDEACIPAFEEFVGQTYEDSELDLAFLTPTEESWAEGDRRVLCSIYAMDQTKLRGSVEGSGR